MSAGLFATAGTCAWTEAWIYLVLQFSFSGGLAVWLKRNNPALLMDRMTFLKSSARSWDKVIVWTMTILFIPYLLLPGLDAVRYEWSSVPPVLQVLAFTGIVLAYALIAWVMRENSHLSRIVEIQKEKDHRVVTTGPYQFVRHPMYVGAIAIFACLPLALGSLWALVPAAALTGLLVVRTSLEDKMLRNELEGYQDYSMEVRYRLAPGIW